MKSDTFTTCVGAIASILLATVISVVMNGWALSTIWNWFIPPIFHLTTLTFMQAIGVSMVFELFTGTNNTKKKETIKGDTVGEVVLQAIIVAVLVPVFTVGVAWIVLQFAF